MSPEFDRTAFLSRIHLFNGLSEAQLGLVAAQLEEKSFPAGEEIIKEAHAGDTLYLIVRGKVRVTKKNKEEPLAVFVVGDYFGEEAMLEPKHRRSATVTAVEATGTLVLKRQQFLVLLKQAKALRANFSVTIASHHLSRRIQSKFKWRQPGEVVYFLARKHPIFLVSALSFPVVLGAVGVGGMLLTWMFSENSGVQALWWVALAVSIIAGLWGLWNGIDWGNDYYIVTDRRVVGLEKVVGLYDSRQEAPLSAIQRINVQTDFWGRQLDYGDLVVRTIIGSTLTFTNLSHPYQAAALIEEYWQRSKETSRTLEEEQMKQILRERLRMGEHRFSKPQGIVSKPQAKVNPLTGQQRLVNLLRLRFEDKATVTYRKHIIVLAEQTWKPFLLVASLVAILVLVSSHHLLKGALPLEITALLVLWGLLFVTGVAWWIYQYIDWSNDIFQVTPDQILDIDKTPLGSVSSDVASLDNILSIEHQRQGIVELLFNYGNVMITVGGGKQMVFENVFNPSAVQEDIERRRLERITKKEQDRARAEREQVVDWFAAYFYGEQAFRNEEAASRSGNQPPHPPEKDQPTGN